MTIENAAGGRARPAGWLLGLALVAATMAAGCDNDADLPPGVTKKAIAFKKVPEALRAAAKKHSPGVDFQEGWENLDAQGKLHSYEIRGRQSNGKIREVRVSTSGEILESE
ncbi:hypothetical protein OJF2_79170 (plasmid) [Aquisphaera giovannonii]|uniref:PepSY domain-containing protein n=1 Tax=Aquisphaera giovannonii TaxID=406548 RepID=A0A5B9WFF2_9BACT|nr:hypothetical protein [Aquisphaera giovannonii]QEH39302.1 hypothetical protein OJF2_79170 [Aquisphaera giovannonii]